VLGLTLRRVQRWVEDGALKTDGRQAAAQRRIPANALTPDERARVLAVVNRPEFADRSPQQIVPRLADQGEYLASESTVYRILREERQLAPRGKAKPATHRRPEPRVATGPNQIWTWTLPTWPPPCAAPSATSTSSSTSSAARSSAGRSTRRSRLSTRRSCSAYRTCARRSMVRRSPCIPITARR